MSTNKFLFVSPGVPDLLGFSEQLEGITVRRNADSLPLIDQEYALTAYLLDQDFLENHINDIKRICGPGSVIVWKRNEEGPVEELPPDVIYQELLPTSCSRTLHLTLRNLFHQQRLKRELAEKEADLRRKETITNELLSIGVALSAERDNDTLLNSILQKSREITHADAGSLYLLEENEETGEKTLLFKIAHNDSNPTDFTEFRMPLNEQSIAGYVAVNSEPLNIGDAYRIPKKKKVGFNKSYDEATGYRTKSILTVPMKDHRGKVLGVVQLINRKRDFSVRLTDKSVVRDVVETFNKENESIVLSLASQAAVSLENNRLYDEIEALFEGFVRAASKAIESRDPTTSGHSNRVALYTVEMAKAINRINEGPYKDLSFSDEQIKELRYASLLHDFGKVGVRERVLVKAQKLYDFQLELIRIRFGFILKAIQTEFLQKRLHLLDKEGTEEYLRQKEQLDEEERKKSKQVREYLEMIIEANQPKLLDEDPARAIDEIAQHTYVDWSGEFRHYLSDEEHDMLTIRKGSLSEAERREIESHVIHSYEFLMNIPWTSALTGIPDIARGHHEKLNGKGYPDGVTGDRLSVQTRMMAVADIFDALTAQDRPYKKAVPIPRALSILREEAEAEHLDSELVEVFIDKKIYEKSEESNG